MSKDSRGGTGQLADSAIPLWSVESDSEEGGLTATPSGCVVSDSAAVSAYAGDGSQVWRQHLLGRSYNGFIAAPDGSLLNIEGESIVTRDVQTGEIVHSFVAPHSSNLAVAPWGDLVFQQRTSASANTYVLQCVSRSGRHRWSKPLNRSSGFSFQPLALGDLVVIEGRGALWAYDRDGTVPWVVDLNGLRPPLPDDEVGQPADKPGTGVELVSPPCRLDESRALVELGSYASRKAYLLDAAAASLTPFGIPSVRFPPYVVVPWPASGFRLVGPGARINLGQQRWEYPLHAYEPDGERAWEHRLPVRPAYLAEAPGGRIVATANPDAKRWEDYHQWYDLTRETFVRAIAPDGTALWTWHPPGRITHPPVVGPDGIVYVGSERRLWALALDGAA